MNKTDLSFKKISLANILSLGFIILGIGCISWAVFNIGKQSHYTVNVTTSPIEVGYSSPSINTDETPYPIESVKPVESVDHVDPLYDIYPVVGDKIGSLTIPTLKQKLIIFQGTGVKELKKGVGHFTESVLPGEKDNCVISGHRETVFSQIGKLKLGDLLIVETSAGTFTYKVSGTRIVHKDDKTVIVPTDEAVLTMTTCYPFNYIGSAPDRYIVSATLVKSK